MSEQYAGALLYLVPVIVAAIVAFVVTRPEKDERIEGATDVAEPVTAPVTAAPHIPAQRGEATPRPYGANRRATVGGPGQPHPTLLHAALSSHLAAVADNSRSTVAPPSTRQPVIRPAKLVSIRRPARIPRRPIHRCPHKP